VNLRPFIAAVAAGAVLAGGALASATVSLLAPAEDAAVEMVPANAVFYANVFLDPSTPQKLALQDLLEKFPKASTPEAAKEAFVGLLNRGLAEVGMTFEQDIEPWLGTQVALFIMPPTTPGQLNEGAFLIATTDEAASEDAMDKIFTAPGTESMTPSTYSGTDYLVNADGSSAAGVVDDFLVVGSRTGLHAVVDAASGDSLEESDKYQDTVQGLNEDRLALFYFDFAQMLAVFPGGNLPPGFLQGPFAAALGPSAAVAYARADGIVFEQSSQLPADPTARALAERAARGSGSIQRLPGNALAAFGVPDVGGSLRSLLDAVGGMGLPGMSPQFLMDQFRAQTGLDLEQDVLSWMGDAAFFISGDTVPTLGGGAVIGSKDPARSSEALKKIEAALRQAGAPTRPLGLGEFEGFAVRDRGMPDSVNVVAADERVLVIYGRDATLAALGSDPSLAGNETFQAASEGLGEGFGVVGYVDLASVIDLVSGAAGPLDPAYEADVKPFLDPLTYLVFGSRVEGDRSITRVVIGAR
jgi:Protein of unknown function (DUF3352)